MGELGIAPRHAPLLTLLKAGEVRVKLPGGEEQSFFVGGGALEVQPKQVTVLADTALRAKDIDEAAALAAKQKAEEALKSREGAITQAEALAELGSRGRAAEDDREAAQSARLTRSESSPLHSAQDVPAERVFDWRRGKRQRWSSIVSRRPRNSDASCWSTPARGLLVRSSLQPRRRHAGLLLRPVQRGARSFRASTRSSRLLLILLGRHSRSSIAPPPVSDAEFNIFGLYTWFMLLLIRACGRARLIARSEERTRRHPHVARHRSRDGAVGDHRYNRAWSDTH